MVDARRVASEEADEVVASRRYSTTSQVWRVASGAKETRRFAISISKLGLNRSETLYQGICDVLRVSSSRPHRWKIVST
jgi:hypothetical protein